MRSAQKSFAGLLLGGILVASLVAVASWISNSRQPDVPQEGAVPWLIDDGFVLVTPFTGEIRDANSLRELRQAIQARGPGAVAALETKIADLQRAPISEDERLLQLGRLQYSMGIVRIYEGRFDQAYSLFHEAMSTVKSAAASDERAKSETLMHAVLGVASLRRGEIDNCLMCLGPSSCILPIDGQAIHKQTEGSRAAIEHFTEYLRVNPNDLRVRWLLNIAYMTLGEHPDKVPAQHLIMLDGLQSHVTKVGRFQNVAPLVGLTSRGPNLAGGSVFDDFTGDGLPDVMSTSYDFESGVSFFVGRSDGTFEDRTKEAGLADQGYALNLTRADFDNDGHPDIALMRGGWETPMRLSLLRNKGGGVFEDVTVAAGLATPITTESAAWGDFDNDGRVDLFVCGEYLSPTGDTSVPPDLRNRCRLYRNQGDGTFRDVAADVGVLNEGCGKGCAWGDYDNDGWLDLFVSNMNGPARLYRNEQGKFRDVAEELGIKGPSLSFACWFWDFDNDGRLDLFINNLSGSLTDVADQALGKPLKANLRPRLYRNLGAQGFKDVAEEMGLTVISSMGGNFGDIDNDGFLDVYLGTGQMTLDYLAPNAMWKNMEGKRFEDVTFATGTAHLQKGHGVSFVDWNNDGALDMFVEMGGGVGSDRAYNVLFQNAETRRHWLKVKLIGTKSNRSALGAKIHATIRSADGQLRSVYRTVGNNSSFGGNSLLEHIGLLDAQRVESLEITWPINGAKQQFRDLAADQAIEITEGTEAFKVLPQPRPAKSSQEQTPKVSSTKGAGA